MEKRHHKKQGFTLFFAILVSSTMLSIALMMLNFALKEQELSIVGKESQFAFFAADVGIECALYWDLQGEFATSSASGSAPATVDCGGTSVAVTAATFNTTHAKYTFRVYPNPGSARCADVTVDKNDTAGNGFSFTTIESRGVNNCSGSPKHRVERAVRASY